MFKKVLGLIISLTLASAQSAKQAQPRWGADSMLRELFGPFLPQIVQTIAAGTAAQIPTTCTPASGYSHCRILTIDHTQVGGSTLSAFGLLVRATLGASRIQNSNCYDVIFTSDYLGTTKIPWEQESCMQSTGAIIDWVGVASISSSANTLIYVSYGNPAISIPQNTGSHAPANIWDSNYVGVWHLPNGSILSPNDSTANGFNLTNTGVPAGVGQIDGATGTIGYGQSLFYSHVSALDSSDWTAEAWVNLVGAPNNYANFVVEHAATNATPGHWDLAVNTSNKLIVEIPYIATLITGATTLNNGTWYHVAATKSGTTYTAYLNGISDGSVSSSTIPTTGGNLYSLAAADSTVYLNGAADELRVSGIGRQSGWIMAEYNNQKTGSTFVTIGSEI